MLTSLTRFHKIMLVLSLLLLVSGGIVGFFMKQREQQALDTKQQADTAVSQVNRIKQQTSQPVNTPDVQGMNRSIPADWEMSRFFADLTTAAKATGVTLFSVAPAEYQEPQTGGNGGAGGTKNGQSGSQGNPAQASGNPSANQQNQNKTDASNNTATANPSANSSDNKKTTDLVPPPNDLKGINSLSIDISAKGKEKQLIAFLDRLQQMPRLVWVSSYDLKLNTGNGSNLAAGTIPGIDELSVKATIYSHAPWNDKAAGTVEWPFPLVKK